MVGGDCLWWKLVVMVGRGWLLLRSTLTTSKSVSGQIDADSVNHSVELSSKPKDSFVLYVHLS